MSRTDANARLAELRAMPYDNYLLSPEWKERRKQALDWARKACQFCNADNKPLHVHHRTYDRLGAELPADLVVLCADCHRRFHGKNEEEPVEEEYQPTLHEVIEEAARLIACTINDTSGSQLANHYKNLDNMNTLFWRLEDWLRLTAGTAYFAMFVRLRVNAIEHFHRGSYLWPTAPRGIVRWMKRWKWIDGFQADELLFIIGKEATHVSDD